MRNIFIRPPGGLAFYLRPSVTIKRSTSKPAQRRNGAVGGWVVCELSKSLWHFAHPPDFCSGENV